MAQDPLPTAVLLTGDLAEHGSAREYERVGELLSPLPMPVHVLPGNHDDRDALRAQFETPSDAGGPVQYTTRCATFRIIVCDSTDPGSDGGRLDGPRLDWLAAQLARDPGVPTIVAMHHPPIDIGIHALDDIGVAEPDRRALAAILAGSGVETLLVVAGHVHRAAFGELAGRRVFTCPSVHRQTRLDLRPSAPLAFTDEPAAIAFHVPVRGELVTHVQPVDAASR